MAIWPDEARLCLWDLPAQDLAVLLYQMIDTGTGAAAYYADILQAVLDLAVLAPCGPPVNTASFLDRLEAKWLRHAWGDGRHPAELARARAAGRHLPDIQLRYATLLGLLGPALDGPGSLAEADAWYCILEGTSEPSVAEAQAMALTELAARAATAPDGEPRAMLLAADDYSAVARRVPISNLYERGRSLGIGVQVSAQTWQGLGRDDDERYRIAATADGGVFVLRTAYPEPLTVLAGHRRVLDTAHKLVGNVWADEGTTRSSGPRSPTPISSVTWRWARPATSKAAARRSCRSPGPRRRPSRCSRRPRPDRWSRCPSRAANPTPTPTPTPCRTWPQGPASLDDAFGPGGGR